MLKISTKKTSQNVSPFLIWDFPPFIYNFLFTSLSQEMCIFIYVTNFKKIWEWEPFNLHMHACDFHVVIINSAHDKHTTTCMSRSDCALYVKIGVPSVTVSKSSKTFLKRIERPAPFSQKMRAPHITAFSRKDWRRERLNRASHAIIKALILSLPK